MKKILAFLALAFLLFCGALFIASYKAESLIASVKPQLEETLSTSLGTKVTFGKIKAKVFPETVFVLEMLSIGEPNSPSVITLNNATLLASLFPLLKGEIVIHELSLKEPNVTVTKGKVETAPSTKNNTVKPLSNEKNIGSKDIPQIPITLNLERLSVENGKISMDGFTANPVVISDIHFSSGASISTGTSTLTNVKLLANALQAPLQIAADNILVNLQNKELIPSNLSLKIFDGSIDIQGALREIFAPTEKDEIKVDLKVLSIDKILTVLKQIAPALSALNVPGTINGSIAKNGSTATITQFVADVFNGTFSVKGELSFDQLVPNLFSSKDIEIKGISIEQAMKGVAPALPVTLFGTITSVTGSLDAKVLDAMNSASGSFNFVVENGGIKGINILGESIKKLTSIPVLGDSLSMSMTPAVKTLVDASDTTFLSLKGSLGVKGTTATLSNVILDALPYSIELSGTYALSGATKLNSTLTIKPELATMLVASAKDLQKALNPDGSLSIPVKIEGTVPNVVVLPDVQKIMKSAAGAALKDAAVKALEKGLGKKGGALKGLSSLF
jgi:hypothetical protein